MNQKLFPTILIALDIVAAIIYLKHGDIRHFGYWMSAAAITGFATY